MRLKKLLLPALMMTLAGSVFAFTPTAAQISQFQSLPKAQQEALARQYGVDLDSFSSSATGSASEAQQAPVLEPVAKTTEKPAAVRQAAADNDSGLSMFGYDVFSGNSLGLTVVDDLPVPLDYQMGPGDIINVQTFGKSNQNLSLTIDRDGSINLPDIGPVAVSGQTFAELRKQINDVIKKKTIGVDVSVTMGAMRTMQVYIVGEAVQPGAYNVNGLTTITQALIASGGVKGSGSLRHIQLLRKGKVVSEFDLYDLLIKGDTSKDLRLSSGDTLFIPIRDNAMSIEGQVARPAVYETKGGATLGQLLSLAGGAKPEAYLSRVSVRRTSANGLQQFTLDLSSPSGRGFKLKNGDKVNLSAVSMTLKNAVAVRGEVVRQGALNFRQGMKVSDAIGSIDDGLKLTADLNYALLVREMNANQDIEVYQFSLLDALTDQDSAANLTLQEKDQIFVFDNGLAQGYWFGSYANSKAKSDGAVDKTREVLDAETGAVVTKEESATLKIADKEVESNAAGLRKASREALLKPIVERLKAQASYGVPAKVIEVSGAVKFPGLYPLAKNINVSSLLAAAGGLKQSAYLTSAELSRRLIQGDKSSIERINFSLKDAISGKYPVTLGAQDNLIIKSQPGWQEGMVIELQGEFVFPGTYTFRRGETLKDVVERAGGFTEFAYPAGAVFSRERLKRQEAERLKLINAQLKQEISTMSLRRQGSSVADPAQAIAIVDQLDNVQPVGRLVIDLNSAVKGDKLANLMLEKGDKLFVPALNPVVSVVGEVQFSSNHTFNPNLTVEDYIASSGGTKRQADTDRIYIVKSNGSVELPNNSFWFSRNYDPLEPGDTVIVPLNTDYLDGLSTLSTATQILYQIGVAWSAVKD
ncbi:sugar transporter [Marinomonas rhizomae]|uniref:Protein involved in polysaccharide export with SLBB domain n=1 Tax=Marinomonas rhizomae TaxID=491948 RepID=A0A366J8C5_9GAMM|nr:SLBB domain-containing protein [Marinomonas rhizomae]RBP83291.1 protein involved in polysaccharide export with SLBB domain [Marinomonas rhizomae]RNF68708.1 sugar transporter [Marinomonas rhizomae]